MQIGRAPHPATPDGRTGYHTLRGSLMVQWIYLRRPRSHRKAVPDPAFE